MLNVPQVKELTISETNWPVQLSEVKQYVKMTLNQAAEDDIIRFLFDNTLRTSMAYTDQLMVKSATFKVSVEVQGLSEKGHTVIHLPYGGAELSSVTISEIKDEDGESLSASDFTFKEKGRILIFANQDLRGYYLEITYTAARPDADRYSEALFAVFAEKYVNRNDQSISRIMEVLGPLINYELWV